MKIVFALGVPSDFDQHGIYVFGRGNGLPWPRNAQDMENFKKETIGNIVAMGSNTFRSLPFRLPNRFNLVLSHNTYPSYMVTAMNGDCADSYVNDFASVLEADVDTEYSVTVIGGLALIKEASYHAHEIVLSFIKMDKTLDQIHATSVMTRTELDDVLEGFKVADAGISRWPDFGLTQMRYVL